MESIHSHVSGNTGPERNGTTSLEWGRARLKNQNFYREMVQTRCFLILQSLRFCLKVLEIKLHLYRWGILSCSGWFLHFVVLRKTNSINVKSSRGFMKNNPVHSSCVGEFQLCSHTINKTEPHVTQLVLLWLSRCPIHLILEPESRELTQDGGTKMMLQAAPSALLTYRDSRIMKSAVLSVWY